MIKKVILICLVLLLFVSCSASWQKTIKNLKSDYSGGLMRTTTVTNMFTGEVVWSFTGKAYISDDSSVGDIAIIYYDSNGDAKKADFIGEFFGVKSLEL